MTLTKNEDGRWKNDWQAIRTQLNQHRVLPARLAYLTSGSVSEETILKGFAGEPVPLSLNFLRTCVSVLGLVDGRHGPRSSIVNSLSMEECERLLRPPASMPQPDVDFWTR